MSLEPHGLAQRATAGEHRGQDFRTGAVVSRPRQPAHHPHRLRLTHLHDHSPSNQRTPRDRADPAHEGPARKGASETWMLLGPVGSRETKLALPLSSRSWSGRSGCPGPKLGLSGAVAHLRLKPCPSGPFRQGQSPEPRMGSAPAIALWDSEVVGPSSHFQVTPAPQARPERPPRLLHMRAENQATKSCVPQPSPLPGASVGLCLPVLTLSYSRNVGLGISQPHPLGQGASLSACLCHLPWFVAHHSQLGPKASLPPTGAAGSWASLCSLRTASRLRYQGPQGLLVTWAGQGASESLPGPAGARGAQPSGSSRA